LMLLNKKPFLDFVKIYFQIFRVLILTVFGDSVFNQKPILQLFIRFDIVLGMLLNLF
jgi:hypothetical protein